MKKNILNILLICFIFLNTIIFIYNYINKNNTYIILDEKNIWEINDNKIKSISKNNFNKLSYSNSKLYRSDGTEVLGYYDNNFKFYTSEIGQIQDTYYDIYVVGNSPIKNYTSLLTKENEITDNDKQNVSNFVKTNNLELSNYEIKKVILPHDITVYSTYNQDESSSQKRKNYIFYYQNDTSKLIYKSNDKSNRKSYLNKFVDMNNDGYVDIILMSDIYNSAGNECYSLYMYKDNEYKVVINCEEE